MLLNEIIDPLNALDVHKAIMILHDFVEGTNDGGADLTQVIKVLSQRYPQAKYKGRMVRLLKMGRSFNPTDIRSMTTTMHQYIIRTKDARKYFSWSTLPSENLLAALDVGDKDGLWLAVEQDYYGFDVVKCLIAILEDEDIVNGLTAKDFQAIKGSTVTAHSEKEILATYSNGVHVVGSYYDMKFYSVDDFGELFSQLEKRPNKAYF